MFRPGSMNNKVHFNTYSMRLDEEINCTVCDVLDSRGLSRFYPCDTTIGYYLSNDKLISKDILDFIEKGATRVQKSQGDSIVYFEHIFIQDTLVIQFNVDEEGLLDEVIHMKSNDF